jgi:hypothetical protein
MRPTARLILATAALAAVVVTPHLTARPWSCS